ncbi:hypothetical protein CN918_31775 [Priestia megaterium]|nr:hypothetical protein CN918_31775 [Priestia megaterium]
MYVITFIAGLAVTTFVVTNMFYKRMKEARKTDISFEDSFENHFPMLKDPKDKYRKKAFDRMCNRFERVNALFYPLNQPQEIWDDAHYTLFVTREETGIRYLLKKAENDYTFKGYIDLLSNKKEFQLVLNQRDDNQSQRLLHCFHQQVRQLRKQLEESSTFQNSNEILHKSLSFISPTHKQIKRILSKLQHDSEWLTEFDRDTAVTSLARKLTLLEKNAFAVFSPHGDKKEEVLEKHLIHIKKQLDSIQERVQERKVKKIEQQLKAIQE